MRYRKMTGMTYYRLHRYFCSSRSVIPLIVSACFLRFMYSVRPMDVCNGYILSGIFQFVLMTFVSLNNNGNEDMVEEQLLLFHGNSQGLYCAAREMTLLVISCFYGVLLALGPVVINALNQFSFFARVLTAGDVVMGAIIILGSGVAGIAIGDVLQPRVITDRKIAITSAVGIMLLSIVKSAIIKDYRFFKFLDFLLPPVMKPAGDLINGDYFELSSVLIFLLLMVVYYLTVTIIKNLILERKKYS